MNRHVFQIPAPAVPAAPPQLETKWIAVIILAVVIVVLTFFIVLFIYLARNRIWPKSKTHPTSSPRSLRRAHRPSSPSSSASSSSSSSSISLPKHSITRFDQPSSPLPRQPVNDPVVMSQFAETVAALDGALARSEAVGLGPIRPTPAVAPDLGPLRVAVMNLSATVGILVADGSGRIAPAAHSGRAFGPRVPMGQGYPHPSQGRGNVSGGPVYTGPHSPGASTGATLTPTANSAAAGYTHQTHRSPSPGYPRTPQQGHDISASPYRGSYGAATRGPARLEGSAPSVVAPQPILVRDVLMALGNTPAPSSSYPAAGFDRDGVPMPIGVAGGDATGTDRFHRGDFLGLAGADTPEAERYRLRMAKIAAARDASRIVSFPKRDAARATLERVRAGRPNQIGAAGTNKKKKATPVPLGEPEGAWRKRMGWDPVSDEEELEVAIAPASKKSKSSKKTKKSESSSSSSSSSSEEVEEMIYEPEEYDSPSSSPTKPTAPGGADDSVVLDLAALASQGMAAVPSDSKPKSSTAVIVDSAGPASHKGDKDGQNKDEKDHKKEKDKDDAKKKNKDKKEKKMNSRSSSSSSSSSASSADATTVPLSITQSPKSDSEKDTDEETHDSKASKSSAKSSSKKDKDAKKSDASSEGSVSELQIETQASDTKPNKAVPKGTPKGSTAKLKAAVPAAAKAEVPPAKHGDFIVKHVFESGKMNQNQLVTLTVTGDPPVISNPPWPGYSLTYRAKGTFVNGVLEELVLRPTTLKLDDQLDKEHITPLGGSIHVGMRLSCPPKGVVLTVGPRPMINAESYSDDLPSCVLSNGTDNNKVALKRSEIGAAIDAVTIEIFLWQKGKPEPPAAAATSGKSVSLKESDDSSSDSSEEETETITESQ